MKLDLYSTDGCLPCSHIIKFIEDNGLSDSIDIHKNGDHPLVTSYPSLVFNGASIVKGVIAIENFLKVHVIPKEV